MFVIGICSQQSTRRRRTVHPAAKKSLRDVSRVLFRDTRHTHTALAMAQVRLIRNGDVGDHRLGDAAFLASFHLPTFGDRVDTLRNQHPSPRESRIQFNEERHGYTIDRTTKAPRSVTGLVHSYASHFNPYQAVECMRAGRNLSDRQHELTTEDGRVMTDEEIVEVWSDRGKVASARGTLLHYHAETFLNGCEIEKPQSRELVQLQEIVAWLLVEGWKPYRVEMCLFSCQLRLAGQADALFMNENKDLAILDWKRSKTIRFERQTLPSRVEMIPTVSDSTNSLPVGNTFLRLLFLRNAHCLSTRKTSASVTTHPLFKIASEVFSATLRLILHGFCFAMGRKQQRDVAVRMPPRQH